MADSGLDDSKLWPLGTSPYLGRPLPRDMWALSIHRDRYGPPAAAVSLETVRTPHLRFADATRVLVAVLASGPNFNTNFAALGLPVPVFGRGDAAVIHVPGSDALGIVVDAGPGVTGLKVGQAVILDSWTGHNIRGYETHDGFNAQFAVVDQERAIPLPEQLRCHTPERLAALLLTYGTAYRAVVERLRVSPGDSVLIMGGGKGTSFAATQIAKALGARVILVGSNPALAHSLIKRGMADAFIDRRRIPCAAFGPIPADLAFAEWRKRSEPFRRAVFAANGGKPVDKVFEHTGGKNFPLLVSALAKDGALAFFGATGKGLKGEYRETFFYDRRRFTFDARWVWMRQKQILFRSGTPDEIFDEIGLLPGRRGMVWGADASARDFVRAALSRQAELVVVASVGREKQGIAAVRRLGLPASHILDREALALPEDMPDPLTDEGRPNPAYASEFLKNAQTLGKALWGIFGPRKSPDFVVERTDQSTFHFSTFVVRDFDERDAMPCGFVLVWGPSNLSILGSHMYCTAQAAEVVRLLASGTLRMEQVDLEVVGLAELPRIQQKMLDGSMGKPKGVALVQADRAGRSVEEYEDAFRGEALRPADPGKGNFLDKRLIGEIGLVTLTRPDALNALNEDLLDQLATMVNELATLGTLLDRRVGGLVLAGAGRAFVAGADVKEFLGRSAEAIATVAAKHIALFFGLESLAVPVVALVDGFALGGGNELAMSTHYRIVTENARLGQPEVKLGMIPGYGGLQRLPRLVGPVKAAAMILNGEPVDGTTGVEMGLADESCSSATALARAVHVAADLASGRKLTPRRDWDALAASQQEALRQLLLRDDIREILSAPAPDQRGAADLRAARKAAGAHAIRVMALGYQKGFAVGLEESARAFGTVTASPGGQEWIRRFLAKDPAQSSFLRLIDLGAQ